ncbi:MAG: right-handed parallel beta-helix repeat-containing protein [Rikenellaceae bacterium]
MRKLLLLLFVFNVKFAIATEYHVSKNGSDANSGLTKQTAFFTIQKGADSALPGDTITVHEGVYRELIDPIRGGISDQIRIIYRAAEDEKVVIKGTEVVEQWERVKSDKSGKTWVAVIPNSLFKNFNPFDKVLTGDWFDPTDTNHHLGEVFLNEKSMYEQNNLADVINPKENSWTLDKKGSLLAWYAEVDRENTTVWANFGDANPNKELVEVLARKACFFPSNTGRNFITISGFVMNGAANQWAPPTTGQEGLIATNWSKGWIIENNTISNAKSSGIALGKYGAVGANKVLRYPYKNSMDIYHEVIFKAARDGWSKEEIGSHIVRGNKIFDCGQAGIIGSLGCVFSQIYNNHIYDIYTKRTYTGHEMAAIKLHGAIDVLIKDNILHNAHCGIWLDWMAQGARITGNIIYNNDQYDFHDEVNHGPLMLDHNLLLSEIGISTRSVTDGTAYVHNILAGRSYNFASVRTTPYHLPHSTEIHGVTKIYGRDFRFFNNIYIAADGELDLSVNRQSNPNTVASRGGLDCYSKMIYDQTSEANVFYNGAKPYKNEKNGVENESYKPKIELIEHDGGIRVKVTIDDSFKKVDTRLITTDVIGINDFVEAYYENSDGTPYIFDKDIFGNKRNINNPTPGPFENLKEGVNIFEFQGNF